jgi:hypothetical protein
VEEEELSAILRLLGWVGFVCWLMMVFQMSEGGLFAVDAEPPSHLVKVGLFFS